MSATALQPQPQITEWLTKEQAALILGHTREWVDTKIRQRQIATRQQPVQGRRPLTLVNPDDIERLKQEQSTPALLAPDKLRLPPYPPLPPPPIPPYLDLERASEWSGLPEGLLRLFVREGRLAAVKYGKYYIARRDLEHLELDVRKAQIP